MAGVVARISLTVLVVLAGFDRPAEAGWPYWGGSGRDFVAWIRGREQPAAREYWRRTLADFAAATALPEDRAPLPDPPPGDDAPEAGQGVARVRRRLSRRLTAALEERARLLEGLSPFKVLERGYSLTTDEAGKVVVDAAELRPGVRLKTRLARGEVTSVVEDAGDTED